MTDQEELKLIGDSLKRIAREIALVDPEALLDAVSVSEAIGPLIDPTGYRDKKVFELNNMVVPFAQMVADARKNEKFAQFLIFAVQNLALEDAENGTKDINLLRGQIKDLHNHGREGFITSDGENFTIHSGYAYILLRMDSYDQNTTEPRVMELKEYPSSPTLIDPDSEFDCIHCKTRFRIGDGHQCEKDQSKDKIYDLHINIIYPNDAKLRKYQIVGLSECYRCEEVQFVCLSQYDTEEEAQEALEIAKKEHGDKQ